MKPPFHLLLLIACLSGALCAQQTQSPRQKTKDNPTYSPAVQAGQDPKEYLAKAEGRVAANSDAAFSGLLAMAAKAALEAGENDKAKDYALRALKIADETAAKQAKRGWPTPRGYGAVPAVDFNANFVLGRLAILQGDIRSAERYLLASGRAFGYRPIPPNMSLALEVLKRGDNQSREAVQEFIQELGPFWNFVPNNLDKWLLDLSAGRTPDFGDYLYQ